MNGKVKFEEINGTKIYSVSDETQTSMGTILDNIHYEFYNSNWEERENKELILIDINDYSEDELKDIITDSPDDKNHYNCIKRAISRHRKLIKTTFPEYFEIKEDIKKFVIFEDRSFKIINAKETPKTLIRYDKDMFINNIYHKNRIEYIEYYDGVEDLIAEYKAKLAEANGIRKKIFNIG